MAYRVVSSFKTDSGGPQINILSYTKIPDYRSWIDLIMEHHGWIRWTDSKVEHELKITKACVI